MPRFLEKIVRQNDSSQFVRAIREAGNALRELTQPQLHSHAHDLRLRAAKSGGYSESNIVGAFALANESLRRVFGFELYDVQLLASRTLAEGAIAEMQTGEGKTFSALPAALWAGLVGRGVHVSTPNTYLAQRDFDQLKPVYDTAGVSVGLLPERASIAEKKKAYSCDVTYGSGYEFGFDYLRDQLTIRSQVASGLGKRLLVSLKSGRGQGPTLSETCQRGLAFAIVDEADNVMIDDATSPLILSESKPGKAVDSDAVYLARHVALELAEHDFREIGIQQVELTALGHERIYQQDIGIPVGQLIRPWATYVETALKAEVYFQRDVHYVVAVDVVQIVDSTTGRIFEDRSWQSGLHQAVEAKEGLAISPEKSALAQVTRQRFYRLYGRVSGMTGTATNCKRELKQVYGVDTRVIPLRTPSQRELWPMRCFVSQSHKWAAIVESILAVRSLGRPVLVGTRTIADSELLASRLISQGVPFEVLNDRQDAAEADIVSRAGASRRITIATNLAGRGTDIKLTPEAKQAGGLHVVVTECHDSQRIDRQMVGRSGRQGDPGSAQTFVAIDDWLICTYGKWLTTSAARLADTSGEINVGLERQIRRIQSAAERQQYAVRASMLRQDLARASLFEQA